MKLYQAMFILVGCSLTAEASTTCPCGQASNTHDGQENFSFAVKVVNANTNETLCTAAILTCNHLITSAHCTRLIGTQLAIAVAEEGSGDVQKVFISRYQEHSGYNEYNSMNDIAILFLESPLKFSKTVNRVCVPGVFYGGGMSALVDKNVKIIGWEDTSPSLKTVNAKVAPVEPCRKVFPKYIPSVLFPTQICTFQQEETCIRNTGSPVVYMDPKINKYVLIGIVSYGTAECDTKLPTVETEVSVYLRWIKYVVGSSICYTV